MLYAFFIRAVLSFSYDPSKFLIESSIYTNIPYTNSYDRSRTIKIRFVEAVVGFASHVLNEIYETHTAWTSTGITKKGKGITYPSW